MKPTTIIHPVFAALMTVGLAACQIDESLDPGIDQEFRTTYAATTGYGCQGCNSPRVNEYPVDTVALPGTQHTYRLVGLEVSSTQQYWPIDVVDDDLVAQADGWPVKGEELIGNDLVLDLDGNFVNVRIRGVDTISTWADGGEDITVYALAYEKGGSGSELWANICPEYDSDPDAAVATIIRDEIYSTESPMVVEAPDMFTLACLGEGVFKMKLMGYGPNQSISSVWWQSTPEKREATLRMLTADYCGLGAPFTEQGTPLDWLNASEFVTPQWNDPPSDDDLEAIWDENGAVCLNNPRLALLEEVYYYCGEDAPPLCDEELLQMPHEWTTWRVP